MEACGTLEEFGEEADREEQQKDEDSFLILGHTLTRVHGGEWRRLHAYSVDDGDFLAKGGAETLGCLNRIQGVSADFFRQCVQVGARGVPFRPLLRR